MKKPWYKKIWIWIIIVLFSIAGLAAWNSSDDEVKMEDVNSTINTNIVEDFVTKFNLDNSCKDIISNYVPQSENIVNIVQQSTHSYEIHMNDDTIYLMAIFFGGDNKNCIARITTNEEDVEKRTILYDFYEFQSIAETTEIEIYQKETNNETEIITQAKTETIMYVYITSSGNKYHRAACRYIDLADTSLSEEEAIACGYTACKICKP